MLALSSLINTSGSVRSVRRDSSLDLLSSQDFPCVVLTDNGGEKIDYKTGDMADVYSTIDLELLVQAGVNQSKALNALDLAVKTVIASNPTLTGTVARVTILPQSGGDTQGADNVASRKRQVSIFYEASVTGGL